MAASPDSEPFNTALADGLKEALSHSEDEQGEGAVRRGGRGQSTRSVKGLATEALQMVTRNPAAVVAAIAVIVYFVFRKPSS